jgi:hypothetical protein
MKLNIHWLLTGNIHSGFALAFKLHPILEAITDILDIRIKCGEFEKKIGEKIPHTFGYNKIKY